MLLECRIPISPRPAWINRVKLIAASLHEWYPDTHLTISCWPPSDAVTGVTMRYPPPEESELWKGTRSEYLATMMDRYKPPFHGDYILMLDADVLPVKRFDEWFSEKGLCGVQAHVPPCSIPDWCMLFQRFGLAAPDIRYPYTGAGIMCAPEQRGPTYFNSGCVFGRRELFERLSGEYLDAIDFLRRNLSDTYWFDQQGLALGIAAANLSVRVYGLRYNFPNRESFDRARPEELLDARFIHAMEVGEVDRDRDFESSEALDAFCARTDLTGSNEILRARVAEIRESAGV